MLRVGHQQAAQQVVARAPRPRDPLREGVETLAGGRAGAAADVREQLDLALFDSVWGAEAGS